MIPHRTTLDFLGLGILLGLLIFGALWWKAPSPESVHKLNIDGRTYTVRCVTE